MEKYILNEQTECQRSRREIRKIERDLRNKVGRNRRRMDGAWIEMLSIRAMRRRERTPARENSEYEIRIQIESHGGRSETGGVGSRQASGLGDEGWRRACDSKKGKNAGWRKWGQNTVWQTPGSGIWRFGLVKFSLESLSLGGTCGLVFFSARELNCPNGLYN